MKEDRREQMLDEIGERIPGAASTPGAGAEKDDKTGRDTVMAISGVAVSLAVLLFLFLAVPGLQGGKKTANRPQGPALETDGDFTSWDTSGGLTSRPAESLYDDATISGYVTGGVPGLIDLSLHEIQEIVDTVEVRLFYDSVTCEAGIRHMYPETFFKIMAQLKTCDWMAYEGHEKPYKTAPCEVSVIGRDSFRAFLLLDKDESGKCFVWSAYDDKITYIAQEDYDFFMGVFSRCPFKDEVSSVFGSSGFVSSQAASHYHNVTSYASSLQSGLINHSLEEIRSMVETVDVRRYNDPVSSIPSRNMELETFYKIMEKLKTYHWLPYGASSDSVNPYQLDSCDITAIGNDTCYTVLYFAKNGSGQYFAYSSHDYEIAYISESDYLYFMNAFEQCKFKSGLPPEYYPSSLAAVSRAASKKP